MQQKKGYGVNSQHLYCIVDKNERDLAADIMEWVREAILRSTAFLYPFLRFEMIVSINVERGFGTTDH